MPGRYIILSNKKIIINKISPMCLCVCVPAMVFMHASLLFKKYYNHIYISIHVTLLYELIFCTSMSNPRQRLH